MAGFNHTSSIEINSHAIKTYNYNLKTNLNPIDIKDSDSKKEFIKSINGKKINLISGGFPCQGFSMAGLRVVDDERNSLYLEMLAIVKKIKPDFVLMENVEGLRSMLNGEVEKKILLDYKKIGYKIDVSTLNSADYGVAQIRKRVIFIGNRLGIKNLYPAPLLNKNNYKTVKDEINRFLNSPENKDINHIFTKHSDSIINRLSELPQGQSLYPHYSDAWKRLFWDRPSAVVKENHGGVHVHPLLPRVLTPRELAALQSFPDDFIFLGPKKWQLVQIGNAVPPLMAKAIGISIKNSLREYYE